MEIIQMLEQNGLLVNGTTESTVEEINNQRGGFLGMLLGTLGASLLGNLLTGKGSAGKGIGKGRGRGVIRAGEDF